ncbi:MAG: universal stress protein [Desulfobacterales bacterium]
MSIPCGSGICPQLQLPSYLAKEILIQTGALRSRLILLGASDRNLPSRFVYGNALEQILRKTPCDVGIYRKI